MLIIGGNPADNWGAKVYVSPSDSPAQELVLISDRKEQQEKYGHPKAY